MTAAAGMLTSAGTANSTCQSNFGFVSLRPNRSSEPEYVYSPFAASPNQSHEYIRLRSDVDTTASPTLTGVTACPSASDGSSHDAHQTPPNNSTLRM